MAPLSIGQGSVRQPGKDSDVLRCPEVVVVHETDGRKYMEALVNLYQNGFLASLAFVEASVFRKWVRGLLREKAGIKQSFLRAITNAAFRLAIPTLSGKTIILGMAPWDFRLLIYAPLRRRNRLIYHTSWPFWDGDFVPRRHGPLTSLMRTAWLNRLKSHDIEVVAVTPAAAASFAKVIPGKNVRIIPHVVSNVFFQHQAHFAKPFRLVFVGELIPSKGINLFSALLDALADEEVVLDIVGDGPLESSVKKMAAERNNVLWHGKVTSRKELADILAKSHLLLLPSIRSATWEELFGMVIIEAMAVGVPAVGSNHVGPSAIIDDGVNGYLVNECQVNTIADRVRSLCRDPDKWQRMSEAARQTGSNYTIRSVGGQWLDVLNNA